MGRQLEQFGPRGAAVLALVLAVGSAPAPAWGEDRPSSLRDELRGVIERARDDVFPALVNIQLVTSIHAGGKEIKGRAVGSGTIIDNRGHVVTNQHVTDQGRRFRCTLFDKQEVSAQLVGEDPLTDLAVLRLDLTQLPAEGQPLPVAHWGNSADLTVGDFVMAMGSPLALSRSVTLGIVSNTERVFADGLFDSNPDDMRLSRGQRTGLFTRWIQHDAMINPGNSGGPLVNLRGEVVGVNELGGAAMGFAIPGNLAREVVQSLVTHGEVPRSWVGATFQPIAKTGLSRGALVQTVLKGSPAEKAGLAAGDVLFEWAGEPITLRFAEEVPLFMKRIADEPLGSNLAWRFERDGAPHEAQVITAKLEKDKGSERELRRWGLTVEEVTPLTALERSLPDQAGALVTGIRPGGSAALAKPALVEDDLIRALDGTPVADLAALITAYERLSTQSPLPESILIEFTRNGENFLTLMSPRDEHDPVDPPREVAKAWLGVAVQPVLKGLAKRLGYDQAGFRVTKVYPQTTAAAAGLEVGDLVTHLNGRRIEPRRTEDQGVFQREIQKLEVAAPAVFRIWRAGVEHELSAALEAARIGPDQAHREHDRDFELTVREITFFDRVDQHWEDSVQGVVVFAVDGAGWAGLGGLHPGDLIQRIDETPITNLETFRAALDEISKRRPERVVFAVLRGVRTRFQFVEPDWNPERP